MRMSLVNLSNILADAGFEDFFDGQIDGDIVEPVAGATGSFADITGDEILYFTLLSVEMSEKYPEYGDWLTAVIEVDEDELEKFLEKGHRGLTD